MFDSFVQNDNASLCVLNVSDKITKDDFYQKNTEFRTWLFEVVILDYVFTGMCFVPS